MVSPDGYDAPGQVSSAYDLTLFARSGLQKKDFREYCSTVTAKFPGETKKDKNDASIEKEHKAGKTTHKTTVKSKGRARAGGGKVSKTETTVQTNRPGNDSKTTTTETKEKDAQGNVVREEKKVDK